MLIYTPGASVVGTNTTADDSLTLTEQTMISGSSVKAIHMSWTGTTVTLANTTRLTLRAGGPPVIDATPAQIRAWLGFQGKKAEWASTATRATLPLHGFMGLSAPEGKMLRLTASKNATPTGSPTLTVHYSIDKEAPSAGFFTLLSTSMGVASGANSAPVTVPIPEGGIIQGVVIPDVANLTMLRMRHPKYGTPIELTSANAIQEVQEIFRGTTVADPVYFQLPFPVEAIPGAFWEVTTGSSWGAGNEIAYLKVYGHGA